ncbi:MAG: T9SS type A sorting domain-containing protein [Bacteroidia bacterium]
MKRLRLLLLSFFFIQCYAQHWDWLKQPGCVNSYRSTQITADNFGCSYVATSFYYYPDQYDCRLVKFNSNGDSLWDKNFGNKMAIRSMGTEATGNVFACGVFTDTISINGSTYMSQGQQDAFLMKLDSSGQVLWMKVFSSVGNDVSNDVHISHNGEILVTGRLEGNITIGGVSYTQKGLFICKYTSSGVLQQTIRSTSGGNGMRVRTDSLDNIYLLCDTPDTLRIDTAVAYPPYYYAASYCVKLGPTGNYQWFTGVSDASEFAVDLAGYSYFVTNFYSPYTSRILKRYDPNGSLLWTRYTSGSIPALNSKGEILLSGGYSYYGSTWSIYLWRFNPAGSLLDEVRTENGIIGGYSVHVDKSDNIYLYGYMTDTVDVVNLQFIQQPGKSWFFGRINGKEPTAEFNASQSFETQKIFLSQTCFNDTAFHWECPGGTPSVSYDSLPVIYYPSSGTYTIRLIAYNSYSSDTAVQQVYVKPEPGDSVFFKQLDNALTLGSIIQASCKTSDGGYCMASYSGLYKFNSRGNLEWVSYMDLSSFIGTVKQISDGYVIISNTQGSAQRPVIRKTDLSGKLIGVQKYTESSIWSGSSTDGFGLCATDDGGFMWGGLGVVKCDKQGNIDWQRKYPFGPTNILHMGPNKYFIEGQGVLNGKQIGCAAQIDSLGNINWIHAYDSTDSGVIHWASAAANGDVVIYAFTGNYNAVYNQTIFRLDSLGNVKWAKSMKMPTGYVPFLQDCNGKTIVCLSSSVNSKQSATALVFGYTGSLERVIKTDTLMNCEPSLIECDNNGNVLMGGLYFNPQPKNFLMRFNINGNACFQDSMAVEMRNRTITVLPLPAQTDSLHFYSEAQTFYPSAIRPVHVVYECNDGATTGMEEEKAKIKEPVVVFPNPGNGYFTIRGLEEGCELKVYDMLGSCIKSEKPAQSGDHSILLNQPQGIYLLKILREGKQICKKIIVE